MAKKSKWAKRASLFGLGLAGAFALFWWWQPWDFDVVPKLPAHPLPNVDPDSAKLFAKGTKVLVVTAHPDDESFYNGGTLTKLHRAGAQIRFVICTDGDKSYYGPLTNAEENRKVRRAEAEAVAKKVGGDEVVFLGYPDGRLENTRELQAKIQAQIERFEPDYILAFDNLYPPRFSHSDHRRAGEAAVAAAQAAHFAGWLLLFQTGASTYRVDISDLWSAKQDLLATHKSQFHGERLTRIENMVRGAAVEEGYKAGVALAEGFRATRLESARR